MAYKPSVIVREAKEHLCLFLGHGSWPIANDIKFVGLHFGFISVDDEAKEGGFLYIEF